MTNMTGPEVVMLYYMMVRIGQDVMEEWMFFYPPPLCTTKFHVSKRSNWKKKNNLALQMKSKQAFNYTPHGMFFNFHTVVPSDHS